ncbi:hypothetical protein Bca52824_034600 [Brassica carinata]|uniref:Uncharacterized protein n=1 Tax=Brassica carinata TaxID=52824 RepID=A0A8X7S2Q3_BRACI|nr:hypothetical protein Bca52824_034600 [Brassica carinata]
MGTRFAGVGDTVALEHSSSNKTMLNKLIEPVLSITIGGVAGSVLGGMVGMVIMAPLARRNRRAITQFARECAEDCSAVAAVWFGIASIMSGIRGKDDITNQLSFHSCQTLTFDPVHAS